VPAAGPLSGILVVDLTRVLAGPFCTLVLADLGARVIKVESPRGGDDARRIGPFLHGDAHGDVHRDEPDGRSAYFLSLNRGKQSIALDLKDDADRAIFEALLTRADVLSENFRPGAMDRLGYGWEALHARYPRLVVASTSGFGQTGPYATRPAYDIVVQAMGGIMTLTGHPGGPPTRVGSSMGDITAGLFTAIGIQAALLAREQSGEGMQVDVAMLDAQIATLENAVARYQATGEVPGPLGSRHPSITPFEAFATRDGYLVIAAGNDELFARLCDVLGCSELPADPRFEDNPSRTQHADGLRPLLEAALSGATTAEWLERLERAGVPCGPVNDLEAVLRDPQVASRNMLVRVEGQDGDVTVVGNPIKLSAFADPDTRESAPDLDADRAAILAEFGRSPS